MDYNRHNSKSSSLIDFLQSRLRSILHAAFNLLVIQKSTSNFPGKKKTTGLDKK